MYEMTIDEKTGKFTLTGPLQPPTPSSSGKTMLIASSHGPQTLTAQYKGKQLVLSLNVYYKNK